MARIYGGPGRRDDARRRLTSLTAREYDVVAATGQESPAAEIAQLHISPATDMRARLQAT